MVGDGGCVPFMSLIYLCSMFRENSTLSSLQVREVAGLVAA